MKTLDQIGKKLPYKVPENYFEDFASKMEVMARKDDKMFSLKSISRPWLYLAAMFVGMLVITNVLINLNNSNELDDSISYEQYLSAQVDPSAIADYYLDMD